MTISTKLKLQQEKINATPYTRRKPKPQTHATITFKARHLNGDSFYRNAIYTCKLKPGNTTRNALLTYLRNHLGLTKTEDLIDIELSITINRPLLTRNPHLCDKAESP